MVTIVIEGIEEPRGCPPRQVLPEQLVAQWAYDLNRPLIPADVSRGSERQLWWRCAEGHEWQASPNMRCRGRKDDYRVRGCPVCAGASVLGGVNDLATTHPGLVAEWHHAEDPLLTPQSVNAGSTRHVTWQCRTCSHRWMTEVNNRALAGTGCPACRGIVTLPGVNTLETLPEVAALWHPTRNAPLTPSDVHRGTNHALWWQCGVGHEWQAPAQSVVRSWRAARGRTFGCPDCTRANQHTHPRDPLSEENPELAAQWHPTLNNGLTPSDVTSGSDRRAWWRCPARGHEWQAMVKARARGAGCPYCAGKKVLPGFNDLATVYPRTASQWHPTLNGDLTPADVSAHSSKKVYWLCENGHTSYGSPSTKNTRKADGPIACAECFTRRLRGFQCQDGPCSPRQTPTASSEP